jgi:hypothetical protein
MKSSIVPRLFLLVSLVGCAAGTKSEDPDGSGSGGADAGSITPSGGGGNGGSAGTDASAGTAGSTPANGGAGGYDEPSDTCNGTISGGVQDTFHVCALVVDSNTMGPPTEVATTLDPTDAHYGWKGTDLAYNDVPRVGPVAAASFVRLFTSLRDPASTDLGPTWVARLDPDGTSIGSWSLTFTSLGKPYVYEISGDEEFYAAHGTFTATMVYQGSGPMRPDVHLQVDF